MKNFLRDESAQATTEYILMMAIMVALLISLIKKVIQPVLENLKNTILARLNNTIFGGGDFHHLRVGK